MISPHCQSLPGNYRLMLSRAETTTGGTIQHQIANGQNAAAVFEQGTLLTTWLPVVKGDGTDLKSLEDPPGYMVGLSAKSDGKRSASSLVVSPEA